MRRGPAAVRDHLFCYCCSRRSRKQICCPHSITSSPPSPPSRNRGFPLRSLTEQDLRRRISVSVGWIRNLDLTRRSRTGKAAPHLQAARGFPQSAVTSRRALFANKLRGERFCVSPVPCFAFISSPIPGNVILEKPMGEFRSLRSWK